MLENPYLTNPIIQIISLLLGLVVLVTGRKLFWLTVGAVGFVIALSWALDAFAVQNAWVGFIIALVAGAIGAVLAILLQRVAVAIAGFLMSGYGSVWLVDYFNLDLDSWSWLIFIVAGIIGAMLILYLFELALIGLSSLVGATMILQATQFRPWLATLLFIILLIVGIVAQSKSLVQQSNS